MAVVLTELWQNFQVEFLNYPLGLYHLVTDLIELEGHELYIGY